MKDSEEAIAKVLAGLRDAEAPEGMEGRILRALEDEAPVRSRGIWRWRPMWMVVPERRVAAWPVACGMALAVVLVVVVAIPGIRRRHAPASGSASVAVKSDPASVAPDVVGAVMVDTANADVRSGRSLRTLGTTNVRAKGSAEIAKVAGDGDSVARRDRHDVSFPAPPMPLTEQEKLLLRIAHKGDPVEVAELDPKQREQQDLREKAEYQRFFARPPIVQPGATQEETAPEKIEDVQQTTSQAMPE